MKVKTFLFLMACALLFTSSSCSGRMSSSVKEYDCTKAKRGTEYVIATPGIVTRSTSCRDYLFINEKLSKAIHIFVEEYSLQFSIPENKVWQNLRGTVIEVSVLPRRVSFAYDKNGKTLKEPWVTGLALSKKHIWVEIKTNNIYSSALAHELAHILIWNMQGVHGDPDHEGKQFSGWTEEHTSLIDRVNLKLLESGI